MLSKKEIENRVARAMDWFRVCHRCGCAWERIDFLCERCWKADFHIADARNLDRAWRDGLIVHSIFSWKDSRRFKLNLTDVDSRNLAILMRALKGGRLVSATDRLARVFWFRLLAFEEIPRYGRRQTVLVPAPAGGKSWDHARVWAEALSKVSGLPVLDVLGRRALDKEALALLKASKSAEGLGSHQRDRDKAQRRFVKMRLNPQICGDLEKLRFVFIDDVVTTGATVGAAYETLGRPKHFECWAIACRG